MAIDRTRYRQLDFQGGQILQQREMDWLQRMDQGVFVGDNETPVSGILQSIYRQGAMLNTTVAISGLVVTLSPTDGTKPMMIFVRNQWETFGTTNDQVIDRVGTFSAPHSITLNGTDTHIYLNWVLQRRLGGLTGDDPSLTDSVTNEATAPAGELILTLSYQDTSGTPLGQVAQNSAAIPVYQFTNSGTLLTRVELDNVDAQALASETNSGLVRTTTTNPIVVSTDDSRVGAAVTSVADALVHDSTVRTPVAPGGTNADGTPIYNLSPDIGGISAAKIVYVAGTQLVSDFIGWIKTQVSNLKTDFYTLHRGIALGTSNTHPFPSAADVGAAPISHPPLPLGVSGSHPPVTNVNTGGFRVNRSVAGGGSPSDPGFGIFTSGNVDLASMNHDGDIYASKAAAQLFSGLLSPATLTSGNLGLMSIIAQVLKEHVNQVSHKNPHGLTAADISAMATTGTAYSISYTGTSPQPASSGYIKLGPNWGGVIIQWASTGNTESSSNAQTVTFPIAFPTGCFVVVGQATWTSNGDYTSSAISTYATNRFNFSFRPNRRTDSSISPVGTMYIAIGY